MWFLKQASIPIESVAFCTYVGQASLALRRKGLDSKTIHSTIYRAEEEIVRDKNGEIVMKNGRPKKTLNWIKKDKLDGDYVLMIIDEGSMVPEDKGKDLESFGLPIMVVGDLNQLDPVFGKPYYLQNPDSVLTQVMRQNDERGILDIIYMILNDKPLVVGKYKHSAIITRDMLTDKMLMNATIILCGMNKTRAKLNKRIRKLHGRSGEFPQVGDKLICRRNNWRKTVDSIPLVNGLRGEVIHPVDLSTYDYNNKTVRIDFQPMFMEDNYFSDLKIDHKYLLLPPGSKNNYYSYGHSEKFEFGEAITAHLSQGSQYPIVIVFEEMLNSSTHKKWLYTAVSRAMVSVVLVKRPEKRNYWYNESAASVWD